jgi:hypothetical protein
MEYGLSTDTFNNHRYITYNNHKLIKKLPGVTAQDPLCRVQISHCSSPLRTASENTIHLLFWPYGKV